MSERAPLYIHGIGTALPKRSLGPDESAELFKRACADARTAKLLRRVIRLTGIERRHLAVLDYQLDTDDPLYRPIEEQPHGPGMGARNALFERAATPLVAETLSVFSEASLASVDTLITCSCTHASSPGLERPVLTHSPVRSSVDRWNLGFMGCSAALAGLRLAHGLASRRQDALLVACELSSLHFQYTSRLDQLTANVLFSDGAAATLLSAEASAVRVVDCRCAALPADADQMVWFADNHGLRLELSQELPDTLGRHLPEVVSSFLAPHGISPPDVDHWLVHPGGPQVLDSAEVSLGMSAGALDLSRAVLRNCGNMSSPTILFILRDLIEQKVDGRCVAMAFGPGLTIELVLLDIDRGSGG